MTGRTVSGARAYSSRRRETFRPNTAITHPEICTPLSSPTYDEAENFCLFQKLVALICRSLQRFVRFRCRFLGTVFRISSFLVPQQPKHLEEYMLKHIRLAALASTFVIGGAALAYAQSSSTTGTGGSSAGGGTSSSTVGTGGSSAGSGSGSGSTLGTGGSSAGGGTSSSTVGTGGSSAGKSGSGSSTGTGGSSSGTSDSAGKSGSAPGHDKSGPGNSENAPGHNKR
ncbi:hypothetical protein [Methylorubrum sp. SL192]|nr:hypothetical protein [Methylorubrum sp. SL192]MCY1641917.1 hypothetical protein [Methylorubrum sp. SL192]